MTDSNSPIDLEKQLNSEINKLVSRKNFLLHEFQEKFTKLINKSEIVLKNSNDKQLNKLGLIDCIEIINDQIEKIINNIDELLYEMISVENVNNPSQKELSVIEEKKNTKKIFKTFFPYMLLYYLSHQQ